MAAGQRARRSIPTAFSSRQHPRAGRPTPRWRMRRSSGAGTSCATGLLPSASFSPGEQGSKPLAARGRRRRTGIEERRAAHGRWRWPRRKAGWLSARRISPEADRDFIVLSRKAAQRRRLSGRERSLACWRFVHHCRADWLDGPGSIYGSSCRLRPFGPISGSSALCAHHGAEQALKPAIPSGNAPRTARDGRRAGGGFYHGVTGQ